MFDPIQETWGDSAARRMGIDTSGFSSPLEAFRSHYTAEKMGNRFWTEMGESARNGGGWWAAKEIDSVTKRSALAGMSGMAKARTLGGSVLKQGLWGGLSAVAPIAPPMGGLGHAAKKSAGGLLKAIPRPLRRIGGAVGRTTLKVVGPVITAYRLSTETKGLGVLGGLEKGTRIVGEEIAWGVGAGIGMALGGAIGSALGLPGTIAGAVIGGVLGGVLGYLGSKAWNTTIDLLEAPFKIGKSAWDFLGNMGREGRKLNLGGQISLGNSTQAAATMRQRALQQINRSGINARSILGREASMMHYR